MKPPTRRDFLTNPESQPPAIRRRDCNIRGFYLSPYPLLARLGSLKLSDNLWLVGIPAMFTSSAKATGAVSSTSGPQGIDHLPSLGSPKWTGSPHPHHRDQCQGDWKAVQERIPIAAPAHESHLFSEVENFWRNRRIFHLYYMRNDFNTSPRVFDLPAPAGLLDFRMGDTRFFVLPSPDILWDPYRSWPISTVEDSFHRRSDVRAGQDPNLFDTQIEYGGAEGVDLGIGSLSRLLELKPSLLCPSHGEPLVDPGRSIEQTIRRLVDYYRFQEGNLPNSTALCGQSAPGGPPPNHLLVLRDPQQLRQSVVH